MTMAKNKKINFHRLVYSKYVPEILVCGWYVTVLVYKQYVKVTKMAKIENSGIKTGICRNLIYERYMNKKAAKNNIPTFFVVSCHVHLHKCHNM